MVISSTSAPVKGRPPPAALVDTVVAALPPEAPDGVLPEYLRLPDAEISLRAARQ